MDKLLIYIKELETEEGIEVEYTNFQIPSIYLSDYEIHIFPYLMERYKISVDKTLSHKEARLLAKELMKAADICENLNSFLSHNLT